MVNTAGVTSSVTEITTEISYVRSGKTITMTTDDTNTPRNALKGTRLRIIQDILGHPHGAPSLDEVAYANLDKSKSTIQDHLNVLIEAEIVARVKLPKDERTRDNPSTFYVLTQHGWRELNKSAIFLDELDDIRDDYEKLEKPDRLERFEQAPRPELTTQGECYVYRRTEDDPDVE